MDRKNEVTVCADVDVGSVLAARRSIQSIRSNETACLIATEEILNATLQRLAPTSMPAVQNHICFKTSSADPGRVVTVDFRL